MPNPNFTFAFILATLTGALFHLMIGGGVRRLTLFLISGWIWFGLGHLLGLSLEITIAKVGDLYLFSAVIGSIFALAVAYIFTSDRSNRRVSR